MSRIELVAEDEHYTIGSDELPMVIGRKEEIRQVIRGLLRADKNGVVLIGEPGVGKTCIVEGLAQLIASGRLAERLEKLAACHADLPLPKNASRAIMLKKKF